MGKQWKQWLTLFWGAPSITADGDCSYEIKRRLLLGRKVMTNLDSILKSRDITLSTKVDLVKAMVFPVVMYGCESWTLKKAEHRRIDAFELWCWRRLLRVPWTARRSNQSILKEISPGCSLEGLMLKLKLQYFVHLMGRMDSFEKTLMLGKIEGRRKGDDRGWDGWMASLTQWTWVWVNSGIWWWTGGLACCGSWGHKELDTIEWRNWTELTRRNFVGKVMSLLFTMLSRLVITFLPRNKWPLISWLQSPYAVILELPKNRISHCFHCFPISLPWSDGTGCYDLGFLNVQL